VGHAATTGQVEVIMADAARRPDHDPTDRRETYTHGHSHEQASGYQERSAAIQAGFLRPHLRAGLRVLDCGCGTGTITAGLAEAVRPGEVVGIDIGDGHLEAARALATERGLSNTRFEAASIYALPFAGESFDVAFANTVLEHLADPLGAVREMRRVLRPSGLVAVRDTSWATFQLEPATERLKAALALVPRIMERNGGSPYYAPHQRRLLREAGFTRTEGFAFTECWATAEATRFWGSFVADYFERPGYRDVVLSEGWLDRATLEEVVAEARAWAERADAYSAATYCAALGWLGEADA
jgi:ubiquinone/menaquinone biosynthesis C-methylase UbiE